MDKLYPKNNPDLSELPGIFTKYPDIQAVYLFGSLAAGTTNPMSDLDLAIYSASRDIEHKKLDILTDLAEHGYCHVDLVFLNGRDIVLEFEAVRHNKLVYSREDFDAGSFYSLVVRKYLDFYPYLEVQRKALQKRILNGPD